MDRREFLKVTTASLFLPSFSYADNVESTLALYYQKKGKGEVLCQLCPHDCRIFPEERGRCGVRENVNGELRTFIFNQVCQKNHASIETIPLYHYLPGTKILSVATPGCNMSCPYCNTSSISQFRPEDVRGLKKIKPENLIDEAIKFNLKAIAFTYTEPVIAFEWVLETAKLAREKGIKIILNTNGFIHEKPLRELAPYLAACKIDLKAFQEKSYREILKGDLKSVQNTAILLKELSVWIELYVLVIEGLNDSPLEIELLCRFVYEKLGQVPLHIARFSPSYKMVYAKPTSEETLERCEAIAKKAKLDYVYLGNIKKRFSTHCPQCDMELILRHAGTKTGMKENRLHRGQCPSCQQTIPGVWED